MDGKQVAQLVQELTSEYVKCEALRLHHAELGKNALDEDLVLKYQHVRWANYYGGKAQGIQLAVNKIMGIPILGEVNNDADSSGAEGTSQQSDLH